MGRPSLNWPLLQHVCVCVLTAAIGLPKLLNVQNPQLTSSWTYPARHICVLAAAANPRPGSGASLLAEGLQTCVSANPWPLGATLTCFILHHTCGCSQQQLVGQSFQNDQNLEMAYSAPHMSVLRAASGRDPIGLPRNTHVYAQSSNWSANPRSWGATLNCLLLQHTCVLTAAIGRPTLN